MKTIESTIQSLEENKHKYTDLHWDWHPTGGSPKLVLLIYTLVHSHLSGGNDRGRRRSVAEVGGGRRRSVEVDVQVSCGVVSRSS